MLLRDLLVETEKDEREVEIALSKIEPELPHSARFKSFDVDMKKRIVYWVTQEMRDADSLMEVAGMIAEKLLRAKCGFWSVWICVRDDHKNISDSPWIKYETL